jgi:hypothetical protein
MLRSGAWIALRTGILCDAALWREANEDLAAQHALEVQAARLCLRRSSWASHESAALLHRLALPRSPKETTLTIPPGQNSYRSYPGVRVRVASLPPAHVTTAFGVPTTTVARTLIDLCRHSTLDDSVVPLDAALHAGRSDRTALASILRDCSGWPGTQHARKALSLADGRRESPLESRSYVFFAEQSLPMPEPQAWIEDELGYPFARVDALWCERGVIGECDGAIKYTTTTRPDSLLAEKRRQEKLENLGYVVVRWDFDDLVRRPTQTRQRILRAFARAQQILRGS